MTSMKYVGPSPYADPEKKLAHAGTPCRTAGLAPELFSHQTEQPGRGSRTELSLREHTRWYRMCSPLT
jgi:hypothetical protein